MTRLERDELFCVQCEDLPWKPSALLTCLDASPVKTPPFLQQSSTKPCSLMKRTIQCFPRCVESGSGRRVSSPSRGQPLVALPGAVP